MFLPTAFQETFQHVVSGGLEYFVELCGRGSGLGVWYHVRRVVVDYVSHN